MAYREESSKQAPGFLKRVTNSIREMVGVSKLKSIKDIRSSENVLYQGYLRKRNTGALGKAMEKMNFRWKRFYVIITDQFIYYYQSDMSSKLVGKFSLYGYNVVKRLSPDAEAKIPDNAITVEHASRDPSCKNYFFAASHDAECLVWVRAIRSGLLAANSRLICDASNSSSSRASDNLEDPIYPSESFLKVQDSDTYSDVDSNCSDYSTIKDIDISEPPVRPPKKTLASPITSPTESYIDFDNNKALHQQIATKRIPLPPVPHENNNKPVTPSPPPTPSSHRPHGISSPPIVNRKELEAAVGRHNRQIVTSVPSDVAPIPNVFEPPKPPTKPKPGQKPVLHVKPRVQSEKIYWNGAKEEGSRVIKAASRGMFLVRRGTDGRLVLVFSGDGGSHHSLHINQYRDGRMGLKPETTAQEADRFEDLQKLIAFYKEHDIHLQNGAVKITLTKAHHECEERIDL
ncbi:uncharacterized protein [Watersipora subatra]|uniref:uncharacterized protein n=1 Tax=Watersipora subatra TaxID=2589382 RepID=UPI00355C0897